MEPVYEGYGSLAVEAFGQTQSDPFRQLAVGATSEIARTLVSDPAFQGALNSTADRAEAAAYRGINTWVQRNWPWLVLGGMGLIVGNYFMLVTAIAQRDVRFKRRGVL